MKCEYSANLILYEENCIKCLVIGDRHSKIMNQWCNLSIIDSSFSRKKALKRKLIRNCIINITFTRNDFDFSFQHRRYYPTMILELLYFLQGLYDNIETRSILIMKKYG